MTQIASRVSFGRANVYNYFQSKEEILLALLQREHELWAQGLIELGKSTSLTSNEEIADALGSKPWQARTNAKASSHESLRYGAE